MTGFLEDYGLVILFVVLAVQACGIPGPPGKTALVVAAILAARGRFDIASVVAVAAAGVTLGGYAGYAIGRLGGRRLLEWAFLKSRFERPLQTTRRFFDRHGAKAVFLARFLPGLKVVAAPAAGSFGMNPAAFALWHTLGAVAFAAGFGLAAYWAGAGAIELVEHYGTFGLIAVAIIAGVAYAGWRVIRKRRPRPSPA